MLFQIKNRFTTAMQFECDLAADCASEGSRLGAAVKLAMQARADLTGANLAGAYLARANLAGAYLARADLTGANLAGAYLARANLTGAYLARADLTGAYLARADLTGANLAGANLAGADLTGADLTGADLTGANLARADLAGANLARAKEVIDAGTPNGWRCVGWRRDGATRVRVGCQDKTIAEGRAYWADKPDRREVLAALDYVEAVAKLRGWE